MSIFDSILGQLGGSLDIGGIAGKLGIEPAMAEKAIAALGRAQPQQGDTVSQAAASSGLDAGLLGKLVEQLGGEAALGQIAGKMKDNPQLSGLLGMLDRDGDGNPIDDIASMAKGLFGRG